MPFNIKLFLNWMKKMILENNHFHGLFVKIILKKFNISKFPFLKAIFKNNIRIIELLIEYANQH